MAAEEGNPFVERMRKMKKDSKDAKKNEHERSVAELQEKNKQRVKELIESDSRRLEQIELSRKILIEDALDAVNQISPEKLNEDGSVSFVSEAFAFIHDKKSPALLRDVREDFACTSGKILYRCSSVRLEVRSAENLGGSKRALSGIQYDPSGEINHWNEGQEKDSFSRDGKLKSSAVKKQFLQKVNGRNYTISPNGKTMIAITYFTSRPENYLRFGSLRTKEFYQLQSIDPKTKFVEFSSDGKYIVLGKVHEISIIDAWTRQEKIKFKLNAKICKFILHPSLPKLIIATRHKFTIYDYETNEMEHYNHTTRIEDIAISPDGRLLAIASFSDVYLYDFGNFQQPRKFEMAQFSGNDPIISVDFNPNGIHELEGFWDMWLEVQNLVSKSGLKMNSKNLENFELSWERQVKI